MRIEANGSHTFSHTSLNLWRTCKRRWWFRYVAKHKEQVSLPAIWSVEMVHRPFAELSGISSLSEATWADCLERFRGAAIEAGYEETITKDANFRSVGTGKRIFEAVRRKVVLAGKLSGTECEGLLRLSGFQSYYSRPDGIIVMEGRHLTVDLKYTETAWQKNGNPWPVKELLPYDDQLLGQAITHGADGFVRMDIRVNPKTAEIADVVVQERPLDLDHAKEWSALTKTTVQEIEDWLGSYYDWNGNPRPNAPPWPKNQAACFSFGKWCPHLTHCKAGWKALRWKLEQEETNAQCSELDAIV